jgi:hypothetical protein
LSLLQQFPNEVAGGELIVRGSPSSDGQLAVALDNQRPFLLRNRPGSSEYPFVLADIVNPAWLGLIARSIKGQIAMRIGLTLSGGGFRALLFHLGVIRRLRAEGVLEQLGCIASVSGGSIMAAHLLANWEQYNSSPEDFDSAAEELISLTKIDVRGRIQRRLPLLWLFALIPFIPKRLRITPTHLLAKYYDRYLFHGVSAANVEDLKRPTLLILSTNLSEPGLTCFSHQSVLHLRIDNRAVEPIPIQVMPLAYIVAARCTLGSKQLLDRDEHY